MWKHKVAGIIDIIAGVLWIIGLVLFAYIVLAVSSVFGGPTGFANLKLWSFVGSLSLLGVAAISGGIMSLRRKRWGLALAGSICAIPTGLGIASTILVVLAAREFEWPGENG